MKHIVKEDCARCQGYKEDQKVNGAFWYCLVCQNGTFKTGEYTVFSLNNRLKSPSSGSPGERQGIANQQVEYMGKVPKEGLLQMTLET